VDVGHDRFQYRPKEEPLSSRGLSG
jgi:hypothetical protein